MADEKILKDELMDAEELEGVVGGYYDTWHDYQNFQKLGGGFYSGKYRKDAVMKAFTNVGKYLGINISTKLVYDDKPGKIENKYYLDGKEISRNELWSIIREGYAANKK